MQLERIRNDFGLLMRLPLHAVMHSHNYQPVCLSGALLMLRRHLCLPRIGTATAKLWYFTHRVNIYLL